MLEVPPPLAVIAPATMVSAMEITCTSCKARRPAGDEPCPRCGAPAYPHRRTAEEHTDYLRAVAERDRELVGTRPTLILRPLAEDDVAELLRIYATPEVARWWDVPEEGFPWSDAPESTRLTIEVDDAVAGLIQFSEEADPKYRHAAIDLFLDPALHGRGLGTEAVRRAVRHLIDDRGHHRITIDPAVENTAAIRSYEKAGFRVVGVMRAYERDTGGGGWHDGVLMELLAGEA